MLIDVVTLNVTFTIKDVRPALYGNISYKWAMPLVMEMLVKVSIGIRRLDVRSEVLVLLVFSGLLMNHYYINSFFLPLSMTLLLEVLLYYVDI